MIADSPITAAARSRRAAVLLITPTDLRKVEMPSPYEDAPGARLLLIADRTENLPNLGPTIFSDEVLKLHLQGERVVILSAETNTAHEAVMAALLLISSRLVIVTTSPEFHVAWANKVIDLSGALVLHVADGDTDLTGMRSLHIDLRNPNPTEKEFVN
jgi:hypothetical protein